MKNTQHSYGLLSISLHWLSAVLVIGLFALGYWMVDLSYYDSWYQTAPDLHKSIGILLFALMVIRIISKISQIQPTPLSSYSKFEKITGHLVHQLLYVLIFLIICSGYLISTADGRGIDVFSLFTVPSIGELFTDQADTAGFIHEYAAYTLIAIVVLHMLAAFKHHFVDKDNTLKRMLGCANQD